MSLGDWVNQLGSGAVVWKRLASIRIKNVLLSVNDFEYIGVVSGSQCNVCPGSQASCLGINLHSFKMGDLYLSKGPSPWKFNISETPPGSADVGNGLTLWLGWCMLVGGCQTFKYRRIDFTTLVLLSEARNGSRVLNLSSCCCHKDLAVWWCVASWPCFWL